MNNLLENRQVLVCYMLHGQGQDKACTANMRTAAEPCMVGWGHFQQLFMENEYNRINEFWYTSYSMINEFLVHKLQ